jgi:hypothetical protein
MDFRPTDSTEWDEWDPCQFPWEANTLMNALNTERSFPNALQTPQIPEDLLAPHQPQPPPAFYPDWQIVSPIKPWICVIDVESSIRISHYPVLRLVNIIPQTGIPASVPALLRTIRPRKEYVTSTLSLSHLRPFYLR